MCSSDLWSASVVGQIINVLVSFGVVTLLFAMIYRFLPDATVSWREVWLGAAITAALFTIGKFLIGLYLGVAGTESAYGAAGSFAVLLIWLYYSTQIFLFGAELTKAYADRYGARIVPKPNADPVTEQARADLADRRTDRMACLAVDVPEHHRSGPRGRSPRCRSARRAAGSSRWRHRPARGRRRRPSRPP